MVKEIRNALLILVIGIIFIFCGCHNGESASAVSPSDHEIIEESSDVSEGASSNLQTAAADGRKENSFQAVNYVGNDGAEQNLIWCESTMENFTIIPIESADGILWHTDCTVVCAFDKVAPTEVIKLDMAIPKDMPTHAVSYYCGGERYVYAIGNNGRDGGIALTEIEVIERPTDSGRSITAVIYSPIDISGEMCMTSERVTVESGSAWHVWSVLKEKCEDIDPHVYLNSFIIEKGVGYLDLASPIEAVSSGRIYGERVLYAIANTYIDTYDIEVLYITVNGSEYNGAFDYLEQPFAFTGE